MSDTNYLTQVEVWSQNRVNSHSSFSNSGAEIFLLLSAVVEVWIRIRHVRIWHGFGSGQIAKFWIRYTPRNQSVY